MAAPMRLVPLLLLLPIGDLLVLVWIGRRIGLAPTVALVIGSALLGIVLGKHQGLGILRSLRRAAHDRQMPEEGVLSGVLVLLGAALLIFPGVISDLIGFALLVPATRRRAVAFLWRRIERRIGGVRPARDRVIEVRREDR